LKSYFSSRNVAKFRKKKKKRKTTLPSELARTTLSMELCNTFTFENLWGGGLQELLLRFTPIQETALFFSFI
jgi:hypothetical protein